MNHIQTIIASLKFCNLDARFCCPEALHSYIIDKRVSNKYAVPIATLYINKEFLEKCVLSNQLDEKLAKNFSSISLLCYEILNEIPDIEEWQIKLKDFFCPLTQREVLHKNSSILLSERLPLVDARESEGFAASGREAMRQPKEELLTCEIILKFGPRKGEKCGIFIKNRDVTNMCGRHTAHQDNHDASLRERRLKGELTGKDRYY
jgi:hypothetical protein